VGTELLLEYGQTDRHDEASSRKFANAPKETTVPLMFNAKQTELHVASVVQEWTEY